MMMIFSPAPSHNSFLKKKSFEVWKEAYLSLCLRPPAETGGAFGPRILEEAEKQGGDWRGRSQYLARLCVITVLLEVAVLYLTSQRD